MDELNGHRNDHVRSINSDEEQSSSSSSFVLQPFLSENHHEEKVQYKLKVPLLLSQIYEEEFFDHFHINYYGKLEHEGLFLASIRSIPTNDKKSLTFSSETNHNEDNQLIRAIIRTENNNYDVSEIMNIKDEEKILQILFAKAQLSSIHHYELVHHIKANEKLLEFDKSNDEHYFHKVGLIYQRSNQINENEIFSNNEMSIEMKNFLNLISERIELKNFPKYRGDLDIKTNQHGFYSYFTIFEKYQIMFNISTTIPSDQQLIQRKSLIANALLCIVFQEEGSLFQPNFILGKVTQVYIIVQPIQINSELYYKIEIWRRSDVEPIINPSGGIYKHDQSFRNYFLALILNTINIILKKEFFHVRIIEPGQRLKIESMEKLCQLFYSYSKNKNYSDEEVFISNSNITKQTPIKHRRFSFIPKIIETFTNNRPPSFSPTIHKSRLSSSSHTSTLHHHEHLRRPTDATASFTTNATTFVEGNHQPSSSTSTMNNNNINDNEHGIGDTNLSPFNNNNPEIKLNN